MHHGDQTQGLCSLAHFHSIGVLLFLCLSSYQLDSPLPFCGKTSHNGIKKLLSVSVLKVPLQARNWDDNVSKLTLINPVSFLSFMLLNVHCFQLRLNEPAGHWRPCGPCGPGRPCLPASPLSPFSPRGPCFP